ncbi:MAG: polyamine aminopropyltransferase [Proteobacteria bacterium]|nr:polyamine aminopropyltransferase [Pseudomonadota bacterium]
MTTPEDSEADTELTDKSIPSAVAGGTENDRTGVWFDEIEHNDRISTGWMQRYQVSRVVREVRTKHHRLRLFDNPAFGRVFVLDGVVQSTERDGFAYEEMLVHPALFAHGAVRRVLIIGCGAGGTLREALRHPVEHVTVVDIDDEVVEACRTHMPMVSAGAFDDPRTHLVIADGSRFVRETTAVYDVIVIDSPDPVGAGAKLFTNAFYDDCKARLALGGILVTQSGVPFLQPDIVTDVAGKLARTFAAVSFFGVVVPAYGGLMTLSWCRNDAGADLPSLTVLKARYRSLAVETQYYTPELHVAAFGLPAYVKRLIDGAVSSSQPA